MTRKSLTIVVMSLLLLADLRVAAAQQSPPTPPPVAEAPSADESTDESVEMQEPANETEANEAANTPADASTMPSAAAEIPSAEIPSEPTEIPSEATEIPSEVAAPSGNDDDPPNETAEAVVPPPKTEPPAVDGDGLLQFNFSGAAWPEVLTWFADNADLTLDLTETPPGNFNYIDTKRYTPVEAIDVLNGYLLPRGYVLLRRDGFLVAMKTDNEMLPNLIPTVPASELPSFGNNELLRLVVPVDGFRPEDVATQMTNILGPKGMAAPLSTSDAIVLQGFGKSLREAVDLLAAAKAPPADDQLVFRSFTLQHIPASDAERQIQNLFGLGTNPFQASMQRRAEWQQRMSRDRGGDDGDRSQAASPTPLVQNIALNMKVSALRQTNSLLVTATPAAISLIENILETIDVPGPEGDASPLANITPELRVYTVDNADEDDVAETIDAVLPGVVINEDGRNNSIHVMATPAEHDQVAELIRIINSGGAGNRVQIITLTQSDPRIMMDLLGELFRNEDRSRRPVITPGFDGRSLIVRGSSTQIAEIQKTLASFGEGGDWSNLPGGQSLANSGKLVRRLPLGSTSDAARIARAVKDILDSDNESESQIRVVFPADNNTSAPGTRVPADEVDRTDRIDRGPDDRQLVRPIVFEQPVADGVTGVPVTDESTSQPIGESAGAEAAADDNTPAGRSARVTIEVVDNELLMYSSDNEALNEVEQIIRELARQMPSRTEWTVFFLRAAPAESTAQTLVDLLNNETYGQPLLGMGPDYAMGGMSGMGGFGQPVMRIVPDARTNSLFVSGPAAQIKQAEQFLKFLDTTELPESLRDRVPRSIAVRHADVNDVAAIIRELYQDFMVDPLAAARGDRGDRRDADAARLAQVVATQAKSQGLRPVGIQLTLAVDEVANTLLVSCNDQLFEQIKQLVEQRDAAAEGSRAVIRVMQVGPGTVEQVRAALSGLSDDISVAPAPDDASSDRDRRRYDRGRR